MRAVLWGYQVHSIAKPQSLTESELVGMINNVKVEPFAPKAGITIETDPKVRPRCFLNKIKIKEMLY